MNIKDISWTTIGIFVVGLIIFFILVIFAGVAYINNSPGLYKYTIDVEGLRNQQSGLITDIIVPLPFRNGQQVISDEDLQYKTFGAWKSVLVMTPYGKMLAFESVGSNLTDIHAEFSRPYPDGTRIENITSESFSPVLPYQPSDYTQWVGGKVSARVYSTAIFIPDSIRPLQANDGDLKIRLELIASEGMQHSIVGKTYRVAVQEMIPVSARNWTVVVAQIGDFG